MILKRIRIIGIFILTLAVIAPEAALAGWQIYYTGQMASMFGSGGRGNFATRSECEAYRNSRPWSERNGSYCSGFDTPSYRPPAQSRPSGDDDTAAREQERRRQLQLQREQEERQREIERQKKFEEEKAQLLGTLKGTGTGARGLRGASSSTLGLKTGTDSGLQPKGTSFFGLGGGTGLRYSKEEEIQEAKKRLNSLDLDVKKIQVLLKVFSKTLLANNSEFEIWKTTVDSAVNDTWEKGKEYLLSLPYEYGTYKLGELVKLRLKEINRESDRALELLAGTTDPVKKERCRMARQWLKREKELAEYQLTQLNNLGALKTTYDLNAWDISKSEDYEKIIEGLSWLAGIVSGPYSHIKMSVEAYTNVMVECYSWHKINQLSRQTNEYSEKVKDFSYKMKNDMKEIDCLKKCLDDYKEGCVNRCRGGSRLHTPPPPLE